MASKTTFPIEQGLRPLLKDMGIRIDHVLRRAGLPEDLLSHPTGVLTTTEHFRLWQGLEAEAADPQLPLRIAGMIQADSFVPPLFAALCSANMTQAVQRLATYKRLMAPMRMETSTGAQGELLVMPHWIGAESEVPFILVATEVAFLMRLIRLGTREHIQAMKVTLHATACITLSPSDADRPFLTANDAIWQMFEPDLRRRLGELDATATTAQRVRSVLLELLPGGQSSIEAVAKRLAMSTRTLQRRLDDEGDSFRSIVNRTREDLAKHYLTQTKLSISEISFLLGFDDPNSFYRAFHGWTGQTPDSMRGTALPN
ncbi:TPA: AraC family transcriptional regulator ligand-binding domain-containing protein [Stenotrophomonas maltophilia]|nr:AraC family transcriptional regulator ligand-binding domain-containing protein [Stenotrophomonas maltophilia]